MLFEMYLSIICNSYRISTEGYTSTQKCIVALSKEQRQLPNQAEMDTKSVRKLHKNHYKSKIGCIICKTAAMITETCFLPQLPVANCSASFVQFYLRPDVRSHLLSPVSFFSIFRVTWTGNWLNISLQNINPTCSLSSK